MPNLVVVSATPESTRTAVMATAPRARQENQSDLLALV